VLSVSADLDVLLWVFENPIRRRILQKLSRDVHYPLQLSRELGVSQQAVAKHLKVLVDTGLVDVKEAKSPLGGPNRTYYSLKEGISIKIDVAPAFFDVKLDTWKKTRPSIESRVEEELSGIASLVKEIDRKIRELDQQRLSLLQARQAAVKNAGKLLNSMNLDHIQKEIVYSMLERPDASAGELLEELSANTRSIETIFREMLKLMKGSSEKE